MLGNGLSVVKTSLATAGPAGETLVQDVDGLNDFQDVDVLTNGGWFVTGAMGTGSEYTLVGDATAPDGTQDTAKVTVVTPDLAAWLFRTDDLIQPVTLGNYARFIYDVYLVDAANDWGGTPFTIHTYLNNQTYSTNITSSDQWVTIDTGWFEITDDASTTFQIVFFSGSLGTAGAEIYFNKVRYQEASSQPANRNDGDDATAWTNTTFGSYTSPVAIQSGGTNAASVFLYIDDANDWSGTLSDYRFHFFTVTNNTTGITSLLPVNLQDFGQLVDLRALKVGTFILNSTASPYAAKHNNNGGTNNFTFEGVLKKSGYNDVLLSVTVDLTNVTK